MDTSNEELLALRDKANLALGFAFLQAQRPADALPLLERVRLEGPFSSKALLGVGWADSSQGEFKRALVPWLTLRKRNLLDSAVQESYLTVPYAYSQLGATGQAAEFYNSAIDSFDAETKRIDASIEAIKDGKLLDRLLDKDDHEALNWSWQLNTLPEAPESRYLYHLLASNEFQEGLRNYRELAFMSHNLDDWREKLSAFDDMLETRRAAYALRVPKADSVLAATDLDKLVRERVDFESRINRIDQSGDVAALGSTDERRTWQRLEHIEEYLNNHPNDPDLEDLRERFRLLKGVMYWRMADSFKARLWNERRSVKELEAALMETEKRAVQVRQAREAMPGNNDAFGVRVAALGSRMDDMQRRLALLSDKQNRFLQTLAIRELQAQKARIEVYQIQARYELAAIYDKSSQAKPKARP
jgi:tetratricopeptide (TPR) repeat protein